MTFYLHPISANKLLKYLANNPDFDNILNLSIASLSTTSDYYSINTIIGLDKLSLHRNVIQSPEE